jgi:hypothetical protein
MAGSSGRIDARLTALLAAAVVGAPALVVLWAASVADRLPDPVARHWGWGGAADGFSSLGTTLALSLVIPLVLAAPAALGAILATGTAPALRRTLAGLAAGLPVFVTAVVADSLRLQLDLADASAAPGPDVGIAVGAVLGIGAAALAAAAVRGPSPAERRAASPPPPGAVRVEPGAALTWTARPTPPRPLLVVGGVSVAATAALAVGVGWGMLVLTALLAAVVTASAWVEVRITPEAGLEVRAARYLPLLRVPPATIAEADRLDVDVWEFGGWGLRVDVQGRTGVILRSGEAVRIRRGDGSEVVVTVDDAAGAAATLNSLADRQHVR